MKTEYHAPSKPLFDQLNIMTIYNLYTYFVGIFVYKMFKQHVLFVEQQTVLCFK